MNEAIIEQKLSGTTCRDPKQNHLFPVFIQLERMRVLIVGGGPVAFEKLQAILVNAPSTRVKIIAETFQEELVTVAEKKAQVELVQKTYSSGDLYDADIVIVAVNDIETAEEIRNDAKARKLLVNVADKPALCDFYLGSIVQKGDLKIAISTNGKSPTIAKRLKETLYEVIPAELDQVLVNMQIIRNRLKGDFAEKVKKLNEITEVLAVTDKKNPSLAERRWKKIASIFLFAFFFMFVGHLVLSYVPFTQLFSQSRELISSLDSTFYWMILAGFLAQLVDGLLGMGYGVVSATVLLSLGVKLPAISGSIHTAEMFSSAASGYSHYRFGNVNKKLFRALLIPGVLGAILGAVALSTLADHYAGFVKPLLAVYTLFLGLRILRTGFKKLNKPKKFRNVGWLGAAGGFLDSFGGGGWGPLVTSTLILKGRTPRYVIGSVSIAEFFVTLASAATFFSLLGISHWPVIAGLIIGGVIAAPIAARLTGKLPLKTMFIAVGIMVIIWSIRILISSVV
nr:TSUP family transporter [uncultured Sediminibacterium sp.]